MAKKIDVITTAINPATFKVEPELNDTAVSIVNTGPLRYAVVKIKFDAKSGVCGSVEVIKADINRNEAQYEFKILTVKEGLFG